MGLALPRCIKLNNHRLMICEAIILDDVDKPMSCARRWCPSSSTFILIAFPKVDTQSRLTERMEAYAQMLKIQCILAKSQDSQYHKCTCPRTTSYSTSQDSCQWPKRGCDRNVRQETQMLDPSRQTALNGTNL